MSNSLNLVILNGRLGKDAEVKSGSNGGQYAMLSVATDESYKDQAGNWQKKTTWHVCFLNGDRASKITSFLKKGTPVSIQGTLAYNADGKASIRIKELQFFGSSEAKSSGSAPRAYAPKAQAQTAQAKPVQQPAQQQAPQQSYQEDFGTEDFF